MKEYYVVDGWGNRASLFKEEPGRAIAFVVHKKMAAYPDTPYKRYFVWQELKKLGYAIKCIS